MKAYLAAGSGQRMGRGRRTKGTRIRAISLHLRMRQLQLLSWLSLQLSSQLSFSTVTSFFMAYYCSHYGCSKKDHVIFEKRIPVISRLYLMKEILFLRWVFGKVSRFEPVAATPCLLQKHMCIYYLLSYNNTSAFLLFRWMQPRKHNDHQVSSTQKQSYTIFQKPTQHKLQYVVTAVSTKCVL